MQSNEYEPSITKFRRLTIQDHSSPFNLFISFKEDTTKSPNTNIQVTTTKNKARVLSKKINELNQVDPTINSFLLDISNRDIDCDESSLRETIQLLLKSSEEKVEIPLNKDKEKLFHIIRFLLDDEESIKFINSIEESLSYLSTEFHDKSIEYLSSHFPEFVNSNQITKIEEKIMKEIIDLYFEKTREINKEEVMNIFNKMKEIDEEPSIILYFILNLDINECNESIQQYLYENVDDDFLESNFSRVIFVIRSHIQKMIGIINEKEKKRKLNERIIECEFNGNELNGIISRISKNKTPEEVLKNEITLTGGGDFNPSYPIINLIRYDSIHLNDCYYNWKSNRPTEDKSWIIFDFGEKKVNLSSYTLRSNQCIANSHSHPRSWSIDGSNDEENWEVINQQNNNSALNGKNKQRRFECEKNNNYYRYIRYKQDDSWDSDNRYKYAIYLSCIELFGSISYSTN